MKVAVAVALHSTDVPTEDKKSELIFKKGTEKKGP